ncbi:MULTISPECIES: SDR family NAD(P)-dependent oxidoreductase [Bradyrhizobium]|uniref:SDR family NAD(P)-dependent oxidoreductase n=1 Tax=Bradyrhizobium TaxID=374 RepID=UPI00155F0F91|nr:MULTISPECIES: SDR family NAD(P)-dependent oxidoreductase [Bradyrhizobium]MDD1520762.1 short-chain dehydrogenase [Bradyrhizobium sp. WBAH30]MDD1545813.1 short-chain dehydrogenase [Bradyrhizobium sp. WBAH41]MDD1558926.1 short-chain dehydrogenase [Bradyrhizobium sp. WBAH23]MDD1566424.1 short-chain dehydrogenase [Bradyrhizobium sp. WBAH33]MDD1592017.1 short-chain dehydrogenase [Bradyrhizobium sp. WBAH42]
MGEAVLSPTKNKRKTIAVFGAGSGLGASLATRFGREGYRVALVARRPDPLEQRVAELARAGIEAVAFPGDLTDLDGIPVLVRTIEQRFGSIDVAVYQPAGELGFVPAVDLNAAKLKALTTIFAFSPIEVSHAVLPGMLARGDGAIIIVGGLSAVIRMQGGLSGVGPMMTTASNYIFSLNTEVASKGVFAGILNVGAVIEHSAGFRAMRAGGVLVNEGYQLIDPDDIAQRLWTLVTKRNQVEAIIAPRPRK